MSELKEEVKEVKSKEKISIPFLTIKKIIDALTAPTYRLQYKKSERSYIIDLCGVIYNPFHNCQTYTIAGMNSLLSQFPDPTIVLLYIHRLVRKSQILVDVTDSFATALLKYLKDHADKTGYEIIKVHSKYRNNTGTNMNLILFNTIFLQDLMEQDSLNVDYTIVDNHIKGL